MEPIILWIKLRLEPVMAPFRQWFDDRIREPLGAVRDRLLGWRETARAWLETQRGRSFPRWVRPVLKWTGFALLGLIGLFILLVVIGLMLGGEEPAAQTQRYNEYGLPIGGIGDMPNPMQGLTLMGLIGGFVVGAALVSIFAFWRWLVEKHGWIAFIGFAILLAIWGETSASPTDTAFASMAAFLLGLGGGAALAGKFFLKIEPPTTIPNLFGSSRWAERTDLEAWGLLGTMEAGDGLFLGEDIERGTPIIYRGDMHALTVAPTRSGKGATAIIPNLLRSESSILVIDPKGENARRTASRRAEMGQTIHIVDPWGISTEPDKFGPGVSPDMLARFNPLDALDPDDPDLASDALLLADALIVSSDKDPFWTEEAKALVTGFILHVVTDPAEEGSRTLGRVRDILSLPPALSTDEESLPGTLDEILLQMAVSDHPLVQAAAYRFTQKADKERSGVISSAQANTHFLDSPRIRESLSATDFRFRDLKTDEAGRTVYLVLPLDRLPTFNRWLRLLITSAMIDLTRTPQRHGSEPVRVILDEFAALEKLSLVESAFGTMAGLDVQLWAVTQDLSQLMRLYGDKGWQTFVSNAGVLQYFGSRDYETAKYAEHLTGMTTLRKRSISFNTSKSTSSGQGGGSSSFSASENVSYDDVQRPLAFADEMMTMHRDRQVLFIENHYPIVAAKHWWFRQATKPLRSEGAEQGAQRKR